MMPEKNLRTASLLFAVVVSCSTPALAITCYSPSPNLLKLGEQYYNLEEAQPLTKKDKQSLSRFYKQLEGRWSGKSKETECRGPDRKPRKEYNSYTIENKITSGSDSSFTMKVKRHRLRDKVNKQTIYQFFVRNAPTSLIDVSPSRLVVSQRHRLAARGGKPTPVSDKLASTKSVGQRKFSRIIETLIELTLKSNRLSIKKQVYSNSVLVMEEVQSLTKSH